MAVIAIVLVFLLATQVGCDSGGGDKAAPPAKKAAQGAAQKAAKPAKNAGGAAARKMPKGNVPKLDLSAIDTSKPQSDPAVVAANTETCFRLLREKKLTVAMAPCVFAYGNDRSNEKLGTAVEALTAYGKAVEEGKSAEEASAVAMGLAAKLMSGAQAAVGAVGDAADHVKDAAADAANEAKAAADAAAGIADSVAGEH